jgi:hypothetical protein
LFLEIFVYAHQNWSCGHVTCEKVIFKSKKRNTGWNSLGLTHPDNKIGLNSKDRLEKEKRESKNWQVLLFCNKLGFTVVTNIKKN